MFRLQPFIAVVLIASTLGAASSARAQSSFASVYQRDGFGTPGAVQLSVESAFGTREARPFGEDGFEQGVRSRFSVTGAIAIEAWGGVLVNTDDGSLEAGAFSAEAQFGLLRQDRQGVDFSLIAGYKRDFQAVPVPLARACVSRTFGAVNVAFSGVVEVPLAEHRDPADIIVEAAATYEVSRGLHLGMEAVGEDLEAFWEPEEAEGGARLVVGPSVRLARGDHLDFRLHTGAILAAGTTATPSTVAVAQPASPGFLGRLTAGYTF